MTTKTRVLVILPEGILQFKTKKHVTPEVRFSKCVAENTVLDGKFPQSTSPKLLP